MLNVEAALQPIGVTTLSVDGGIAATADTAGITLGAPFGDAPELHSVLTAVPIRDSYDRDFAIDLSSFVWHRPASHLSGLIEQRTRWNSAAYPVGLNARVAVRLYDKPELPFQAVNGLEEPDRYRGTIEFRATNGTWSWTAGTGLGLATALADENPIDSLTPLTRAFSNMMEAETGPYATARLALNERTRIAFGVSHARGNKFAGHYLKEFEEGVPMSVAALRLDHAAENADFTFELGSAFEDGAILGAYGTGALTLAERSTTIWTRIGGEYRLGANWSIKGTATIARSGAVLAPGSLVAALDPILSTAAAFGIERAGLFARDDVLTLTVNQPLRAESAPISLFAAGVDQMGAPMVGTNTASLTPSGREIGFEIGYGTAFGRWQAQANLAYRLDAAHVARRNDVAGLLWLSRRF